MIRSGIAQQLSEIDGYYSGRSTACEEGKGEGNADHIEELSDENEHLEQEESKTEEQRDAGLEEEERETRLAVMRTQEGYAFVDERWKRTDVVTRGDDSVSNGSGP